MSGGPALQVLDREALGEIPDTVEAFLERLGGPAWIRVRGRDASRSRVVVTLLHGNEPSGARAVHHFLASGETPAVDLVCVLGAVQAALGPPLFGQRTPSGGRDLNRSFRAPYAGPEGRLARELLERLRRLAPEALIDLHNTSASSPPYAVATEPSQASFALAALFVDQLVLTDLQLGALTEASQERCPSIVIECGGARDPEADVVARTGLASYAAASVLRMRDAEASLSVLHHPKRVVLRHGGKVAFGAEWQEGAEVTLREDLPRFNFSVFPAGEPLGWPGPRGLDALAALDGAGRDLARRLFRMEGNALIAARNLRPLMITTDPTIAASDCLFYVVES